MSFAGTPTSLTVSVVLCTLDRPLLLKDCFRSILEGRVRPCEIIVVDQSRQSGTQEVVEGFRKEHAGIVYIRCTRAGKSYGLNLAIEQAGGDVIAFTDDDCIVSSDWLEEVQREMRDPDLACITGQVMPQEGARKEDFLNLVLSEERKVASSKTNPWRLGCVGCNMAIRKVVLPYAGPFDESLGPGALFKSALDGDMVYRILKGNRRVVYSPLLKVYHSGWRGTEENQRLRYAYALGLGAFAAKYLKQGDFYPFRIVFRRFIHKLRRMLLGILLLQKERFHDGYLHIQGISRGFFQRLCRFDESS